MSRNVSDTTTVSDALLDIQQEQNRRLNLKRFGVLVLSITVLCGLVLPYTLTFIVISVILAGSIAFYPDILYPLYWLLGSPLNLAFGLLLRILFYTLVCPVAYILRLLGIDLMQRELQPEVESYWTKRTNLLPHGKYMTSQR